MRPTPEALMRLALDAMQHRDALAELAAAADYADKTAPALDAKRTESARRLAREAEAAEFIYYALDNMAEAAAEQLRDAHEAEALHPQDDRP